MELLDGTLQVKIGTVTPAFLQVIDEIAAANHIVEATISGDARGARVRLTFSSHVPVHCQQQLRNWWADHGRVAAQDRLTNRCD
ncbi:MAG: DUF3634 family protein [Pirellulales bacterium]|nr:DUF3634 family protein [Pirellulales bacterium]